MFGPNSNAIVLVHGAWVGEWSWNPVLPHLRSSGRCVYPVSLTGHGTRRHQSGPHVTLADHVADVINTIEVYDLVDVTLVGHSYGGRVISGVWQGVPDRIRRIIYVDAHAPVGVDAGQSVDRALSAAANGGMLEFTGYDPDPALVGGQSGFFWFMDRVMPQSFATFVDQGVRLPDTLDKTFVFATRNEPSRFSGYAELISIDPSWKYVEMAGSHWLMYSHPAELAALIVA